MTVCMVAVEDDFTNGGTGSGNSSTSASAAHSQSHTNNSNFEMNPQQSSTSYAPGPGFYGQPGAGFPGAPGAGYQGPMSPYGGAPMSPYSNQSQGPAPPPNGAVTTGSMYGNQNNSPIYNQNQSSSYPPSGGAGNYQAGAAGFQSSMQSYYNNHSPTHQYQYGAGGAPPVRLSPPPMGMMIGSRIPHPNMNSPNQNVVTGNNQMKTENMDLKTGAGGMYSHGAPASQSQGYTQSSYGYNGYSGMSGPGRPLVSPMSPHGRLNISPGGPNLSPREGPPNMSPHPSMYSQQQPSPGPGSGSSYPGPMTGHHGSFQAQYSEYFTKQSGAQHSPLSSGSGGYTGQPGGQGTKEGETDKLSDAQSNAGSVRSGDQETGAGDTPAHSSFGEDSNHTLTNLVPSSIKKEISESGGDTKPSDNDKLSTSADSDMENKFELKSEKLKSEPEEIKTEGSYYEENKDFTLKANQTLIDNMDINSIPELPEIPELKYDDVSEMNRLQHNTQDGDKDGQHKNTPPGLSPECKDGMVRNPWEEGGEEEGYHDMGWGHMQEGMDQSYPGAHQMPYPNQQQMWANFYGSGGGPPGGPGGGGDPSRYPPLPPHMGMEPGGWWQGHGGPGDLGPYRMGGPPGPGMPPAPGPWALRGPRPRGERRGPGRPRLTNKGDPRGDNRPRSAGLPGATQFPSPYPDGMAPEMMGDHKRGPGRPKALMDPNSPKVPGDTTKNGNKKRYTCEVCQKRFSTAWYVRVHRRSHNGERPYVCNNCGKGFMLPNVLQVHLRKCEKNNPPGAGGGPGSQSSMEGEAPNQSPNSNSSGPPGFRTGYNEGGPLPPSQSQTHPGYPGPMGGYNQRYLAGMGSPPFSSGMTGDGLQPGGTFPGDQSGGYHAMPPSHSPHSAGLDRSPPQFSPMYSPNSNNLPINSESEHHFLANDKPRDKGGGGALEPLRSAPPGVDPSLYCATCDLTFEDKTTAEDHVKTHRPFSCEMCDKRFSQKCNLVTHMRLHTGDKPYKCEFCDKRFTQKGNLDAHIKTHTKEKPFQCTLCNKRFAFKSSLQSHIRAHQNGRCPDVMDEEDLDSLKENAKMSDFDSKTNGSAGDSCNDDDEEDLDNDDNEDGLSPSMSPPLSQFGATIQQFNSNTLSPDTDISKLTDSRQTVAMLQ